MEFYIFKVNWINLNGLHLIGIDRPNWLWASQLNYARITYITVIIKMKLMMQKKNKGSHKHKFMHNL